VKQAIEPGSAAKHPPGSEEFGAALKKIRKRRLYLWAVILIYMPAMWMTLQLTQSYHKTAIAFIIWVIILTIIATVAAVARCPGCGNYFHMHGATLLYLRKCLHCGLHINSDKKTD
jgi:hypothetical protein